MYHTPHNAWHAFHVGNHLVKKSETISRTHGVTWFFINEKEDNIFFFFVYCTQRTASLHCVTVRPIMQALLSFFFLKVHMNLVHFGTYCRFRYKFALNSVYATLLVLSVCNGDTCNGLSVWVRLIGRKSCAGSTSWMLESRWRWHNTWDMACVLLSFDFWWSKRMVCGTWTWVRRIT